MNKKRKMMLSLVVASILMVSIFWSYGFFMNNLDNNKQETAELKTGTMALTFEDNDNGIRASLDFGSSVTKKFKIINTGTLEASLSLDWKNLVNTYLNRSLSYNLTYAEEEAGPYKEVIPETNMPTSDTPIRQAIASELSVPAGDTYYYNLTITLNDLDDMEQDDDLDAGFNTEFDVGEPSRYRYYRLTVDLNGGDIGDVEREYLLKNKETITIDSNPTKEGYTFIGWKLQGNSSTFVGNTFTMGISDTYLIAQYTSNTHILTIDPNGGVYNGPTTIDARYQMPVEISTPTKEGYTFTGWTSEDGRMENDKFILTKEKDTTITATWAINKYKYIVYHNKMNLDGKTYTLVSADTDEGEAEYGSTVTPSTKNYTGFTPPSTAPLTIGYETVYPPVLNKIDYNYERNKYTLTIDLNGGVYDGPTTKKMFYEEDLDFLDTKPSTKSLITSSTLYKNFTNVTNDTGNPFVYDSEAGTYSGTTIKPSSLFSTSSSSITFSPRETNEYYICYDASMNSRDTAEIFLDGTSKVKISSIVNDCLSLGNIGSENQIKVTITAGRFSSGGQSIKFHLITDVVLKDNYIINPRRTGYILTGWTKTSGNGTVTSSSFTMGEGNATIHANYTPREYSVTFNANGGTTPTESKTVTYDSEYGELPIPTYEDYKFMGWFTEPSGGTQVLSSDIYNKTEDQILYAQWQVTTATIRSVASDDASDLWSHKTAVTSIVLETEIEPVTSAAYIYDIGSASNTLKAYLVTNEDDTTKYTAYIRPVYIQQDNKIKANKNSSYLFKGFTNLQSILGLDNLDTSNVTNMLDMFRSCSNLISLDVSNFVTSNVTNMSGMFYGCSKLTSLDVSKWDTSRVTYMGAINNSSYGMFENCSGLTTLNVSEWNTSNVTNMSYMFHNCGITNLDVSKWDTSSVTNMGSIFHGCSKLTSLNVSKWDTSSITNMVSIFHGCSKLTSLNVSKWDTSKVTYMSGMFWDCSSLTSLDVSNFNTNNVTNMSSMFEGCSSLTSLDVSNFNTDNVINMSSMFNGCGELTILDVSNFVTSKVTTMSGMFSGCSKLTTLDVSNFVTSNVAYMNSMFSGCSGLTSLDVSNFNTDNVTKMSSMFNGCSELTILDVSNFVTSNVTDMNGMFDGCSSLTILDVSNFDTSNVTNMKRMFYNCSGLTSLDVSNFVTIKVTEMYSMFHNCSKLTSLNINKWDTSRVTNMGSMFSGCSGLMALNLGNMDISNVTNKSYMFSKVPSNIKITVGNTTLRDWCIETSSIPKLTVSNFIIG